MSVLCWFMKRHRHLLLVPLVLMACDYETDLGGCMKLCNAAASACGSGVVVKAQSCRSKPTLAERDDCHIETLEMGFDCMDAWAGCNAACVEQAEEDVGLSG